MPETKSLFKTGDIVVITQEGRVYLNLSDKAPQFYKIINIFYQDNKWVITLNGPGLYDFMLSEDHIKNTKPDLKIGDVVYLTNNATNDFHFDDYKGQALTIKDVDQLGRIFAETPGDKDKNYYWVNAFPHQLTLQKEHSIKKEKEEK